MLRGGKDDRNAKRVKELQEKGRESGWERM